MKNPSNDLRTAYYNALNGFITVNGVLVPIYSKIVPANNPQIYIILSTETGTQEKNKDRGLREHTLVIDIVTLFDAFTGDVSKANEIEEKVSQIINNGTQINLSPRFNCITTREEQNQEIIIQTSLETIIRKVVRYAHLIEEI